MYYYATLLQNSLVVYRNAKSKELSVGYTFRFVTCKLPKYLNPHLPNGDSHPYQLDESIFHLRDVWCSIIFSIEIPVSKQSRP